MLLMRRLSDVKMLSVWVSRALDDIQESIRELKFYRANVFKPVLEEKKRKIVENGDKKSAS